ncbi:hypothetical protein ACFP51_28500 [Streptomyces pratens]|uniref:Integrase catalytic domain-containing protein n=1 Tax=Streptomyces pratens TaxID=887456 RepID=A0ABW1LVV3_9ACTN
MAWHKKYAHHGAAQRWHADRQGGRHTADLQGQGTGGRDQQNSGSSPTSAPTRAASACAGKLHTFHTSTEARIRIAAWITDFYNTRRLHSVCGFKSPIDYENEYWAGPTLRA